MHDQSRRNSPSAFAATLIAGLLSAPAVAGGPTGTTITYQGLLSSGGSQVDGPTDLEFRLFDQETLGTQIGNAVILTDEPVNDGLLTVDLDFGVNPYTSAQPLWLETVVEGQPLSRQQVTSAPFSLGTRGIAVASNGDVTTDGNLVVGGSEIALPDFWDISGIGASFLSINETNVAARLAIAVGGNVGIGTTTPTARLDVVGDIRSSGIVSAKNGAVRLDKLASNSSGLYHSVPGQHVEFLGNNSTQVAASDFLTLAIGEDDRALLNSTSLKLLGGHDLWVDGGDVGIGTGAPAEKLDVVGNIHASGTVSANAFSSNSPLQLQTAGTTRIFVNDTNGHVGIGTSTPTETLEVNGSVRVGEAELPTVFLKSGNDADTEWALMARTDDTFVLRDAFDGKNILEINANAPFMNLVSPSIQANALVQLRQSFEEPGMGSILVIDSATNLIRSMIDFESDGDAFMGTDVFLTFSDERLKKNIHTLENPIDAVKALRGVSYERTDHDSGRQIGFVAQEVEQVLPELVSTGVDGMKMVAYSNMTPVLVEAVKAQQAQIDSLRAELAELKAAMK